MNKKDSNEILVKMDIKRDILDRMDCLEKKNSKEHSEILDHIIKTNGKVKLSFWIATTAISLGLIAIGFLFNHLSLKP